MKYFFQCLDQLQLPRLFDRKALPTVLFEMELKLTTTLNEYNSKQRYILMSYPLVLLLLPQSQTQYPSSRKFDNFVWCTMVTSVWGLLPVLLFSYTTPRHARFAHLIPSSRGCCPYHPICCLCHSLS